MSSVDRAIQVLETALKELKKTKESMQIKCPKEGTKPKTVRPAGKPSPLQTVSTLKWKDSLRG